jgi:hypothetical protein
MKGLADSSASNHLYIHYYRFGNTVDSYSDWDIWVWPYKPTAGEGVKFDWVGRTQSADHLSATGDATLDDFGGAQVDIDLTKTYAGGWNADTKTMGGAQINYYQNSDTSGALDTHVGFQIVKSSTRPRRLPPLMRQLTKPSRKAERKTACASPIPSKNCSALFTIRTHLLH